MKQIVKNIAKEDLRLTEKEAEQCLKDYNKEAAKPHEQHVTEIDCQDRECKHCRFGEAIEILKVKEQTRTEANDPKMYKILKTLNDKRVIAKLHKENETKESIKTTAIKPEQEEDDPWLTKEEMKEIEEAVNKKDENKIKEMTEKQTLKKQVDIMQYASHVRRENDEKLAKQIEKTKRDDRIKYLEWLAKERMENDMKQTEKEAEETIAEAELKTKQKRTMLQKIQDNINRSKLPIQLDQPTPADGNCGPETLLQQLDRPELQWYNKAWLPNKVEQGMKQKELRERIKCFAEEEEENNKYLAILKRNYETLVEPWQEYWNRMEKSGEWVDYYWWTTAAIYLQMDVIVINEESTEENPYFIIEGHHDRPKGDDPEPVLIIAYQDNHFQSLLPTQLQLTEDWIEQGKKKAKPWPERLKTPQRINLTKIKDKQGDYFEKLRDAGDYRWEKDYCQYCDNCECDG